MWAEIWTLPELGSFSMVRTGVPGVGAIRRPASGIGRGELKVPTDWAHLTDLLDTATGSLVRICQRDASGNREVVAEWYPEGTGEPHAEHSTTSVTGPTIEARLDSTVLLPYDWPTNPTVDTDWLYGDGRNLLVNGDFEDGEASWTFETETEEGWVEYTGADIDPLDDGPEVTGDDQRSGSFSLKFDPDQAMSGVSKTVPCAPNGRMQLQGFLKSATTGKRFIMFCEVGDGFTDHSTNSAVRNSRIEVELDGATYGSGSTDGTFQQFDIDVTTGDDQTELTFGFLYDDTSDGPLAYVDDITIAGYSAGVEPWEPMYWIGATSTPPVTFELATHPDTASNCLKWKASADALHAGGCRQAVSGVQRGRTMTATGTIYQESGSTRTYVVAVKREGGGDSGGWTASVQVTCLTGVTTRFALTFTSETVDQYLLDIRKYDTNTATDVYVDDVEFYYGLPPQTAGEIWGDILTDAQTAHAAESGDYAMESLTWLKKDFTDAVDSAGNAWAEDLRIRLRRWSTYGQIMDQFVRLGYEYRIVPNPSFGSPDTESHLLQIFNPWDSATYTGGVGTDRTGSVKITSGQNVLTGPIAKQALPRTVAIVEDDTGNIAISKDATGTSNWGQRQMGALERNAFEIDTLESIADVALSDRALTSASQITMTTGQFLPLIDFEPGDTIMFSAPPKVTSSAHRVAMVTIEFGDQPAVWTIDFDKPVFTGLAGTVHAVNQLLRRSAEPPEDTAASATSDVTPFTGPIEPTFLVAASDARQEIRDLADFRCDGTNDHVEIQSAVDALPATGGRVQLTEGTFSFNTEGSSNHHVLVPDYTTVAGTGRGTVIEMYGSASTYSSMNGFALSGYSTLRDMSIDLSNVTSPSGTGNFFAVAGNVHEHITGIRFAGLNASSTNLAVYVNAGQYNRVDTCQFFEFSRAVVGSGLGVWGAQGVVVSACMFSGGNSSYEATGVLASGWTTVQASTFYGCHVETSSNGNSVIGCWFDDFGGSCEILLKLQGSFGVIVGNRLYGAAGRNSITCDAANAASYLTFANNLVYGDMVLDNSNLHGISIVGNTWYDGGIKSDTGATAYEIQEVRIVDNAIGGYNFLGDGFVQFTGTNRVINGLEISHNRIQTNNPGNLIDVDFDNTPASSDEQGFGILINDNFLLVDEDTGSAGKAIRVSGVTGAAFGGIEVCRNHLVNPGDGILIENVQQAVVKDNTVEFIGTTTQVDNWSSQLVVDGCVTAVVDGNSWRSALKGDDAGTGAAVYVQVTDSGSVRNNDIWGIVAGSLDTALEVDGPAYITGNKYHGEDPQYTGTAFTNEIVVTGTGAEIGLNPSSVDVSGATTPTFADGTLTTYVFADSSDPLTTTTGAQPLVLTGAGEIVDVRAVVGTAPTGSTLIVDVNVEGSSLWALQASQPTIAISGDDSGLTTPDQNATYADGDHITVDIDQIGSTVAGSHLTVTIRTRSL